MAQGAEVQPLEVSDFSGGITENILQGATNRYARADNYLITVDKKLTVRPGFIAYDLSNVNYMLPSGNTRVNGSYTFINETILAFQSGRRIFTEDPSALVWTEMLGPSGNAALGGGDIQSQNTYAEFQRQVYMTNDGVLNQNGILPVRLYRNTSNVWVSNTAGLPRAYVAGNYTNASLLAACIASANALRTSMLAHFADSTFNWNNVSALSFLSNVPPNPISLHLNVDQYSSSYFVAQTFGTYMPELPVPVPTPAGPAVDQPSLFTLITALNAAYTHHITDATRNSQLQPGTIPPYYHFNKPMDYFFFRTSGPGAALTNNATPTALTQAAAMLDDITQKWYWHRYSLLTHSNENDPVKMDRYGQGLFKIGTVNLTSTTPTITGDFTDVYNFVNNIKYLINSHVKNLDQSNIGNYGHKQPDNYYNNAGESFQITLPDCNSFDSMCLLIYYMRNLWNFHAFDATNNIHRLCTWTQTIGSPNITSVVLSSTGAALTIPVGSWLVSTNGAVFQPQLNGSQPNTNCIVAKVIASASGTATLDRVASTVGGGSMTGQYSPSRYHNACSVANGVATLVDTQTAVNQAADALTTSATSLGGSDYASWLALATELFYCVSNHTQNQAVHMPSTSYSGSNAWAVGIQNIPYAPLFIPTAASFAYAFFFTHRYTVEPNGIQYLVQGNPTISASTYAGVSYPIGSSITSQNTALYPSAATTTQRQNVITNLPVLTNDTSTNYDTANINLQIYRTTNGGSTYYLLASVPNGTTSYTDITNDTLANPGSTALSNNQPIYTSGGVVGSDQPPQCQFMHVLAGTVYYAGITQSGQYFPQRILQAVQFAPDWAPATFFDDMDDVITGLSSTRSNLIVFCKNSIYRESGGFNLQGQGALLHERISDTLGCQNAKSIVRTEIGVFFAGNDGFYYTDGYQIINITLELKKTYQLLTATPAQVRSIFGSYDKITRRVWWSMKLSPTDTANSILYTFYLDYGVKPSGTFTLSQNPGYLLPASHVFQQGTMYIGHEYGFILKADPNTKTDVMPVIGQTSSQWTTTYIPFNFTSLAVDLGTTFKRKYLTKLHLVGDNVGNAAIQINAIRDKNADGKGIKAMAPINYTNNVTWGNPMCVWGDATQIWNNFGKMDLWRRFPASSLRADFMQVQFIPQFIAVYSSSVSVPYGANTTINNVTKVATILTPNGYTNIVWPLDVVGYVIAFQTDGYVQTYPITAVAGNTITYVDPNNLSVNNTIGVGWVIRGIKKEQRHTITSFVVHYMYLGDKNQAYPGATSNSGPGNGGENPS